MKKIYLKIFVDLVMAVMFICLTKIKITGMYMHEVLGCILGGIVLIHLLLNIKWIKNMTVKIFDKNLNNKIRCTYFFNLILLILFVIVFVSGILVSVTIFRSIASTDRSFFAMVHRKSALVTFIFIIAHAVMHKKMIKGYCMRMCSNTKEN